jgi:hypothetical protein
MFELLVRGVALADRAQLAICNKQDTMKFGDSIKCLQSNRKSPGLSAAGDRYSS